jgi:hypothetical protein
VQDEEEKIQEGGGYGGQYDSLVCQKHLDGYLHRTDSIKKGKSISECDESGKRETTAEPEHIAQIKWLLLAIPYYWKVLKNN